MADAACFDTLIFVHLPKCGGTTLNRLIEWEYPITRVYSIDPSFFKWSYRKLLATPPARLVRMRVIQGHMPFGVHRLLTQKTTYVTVLRDPIDRGISEYYYALSRVIHPQNRMMKKLSLEEYIRMTPYANVQTKLVAGQDPGYDFLGGECDDETLALAKENLSKYFSLVGLTERFDETLSLAKILFGWKIPNYGHFNVTSARPRKEEVPAEIRDVIKDRYSYDIQLYEYATGLFDQLVNRHAERIREELHSLRDARTLAPAQAYYFRGASAVRKAITRLQSYL